MKKILILLLSVLVVACKPGSKHTKQEGNGRPVITVTIEPLRYFTEAIAGDRFNVVSMVPKGSSPETYDPTPQQLVDLAQSKAYFRIGYIGFEQTWADRLADNAPHLQFFDLSRGVELILDHSHTHRHPATPESNYQEEEGKAEEETGERHLSAEEADKHPLMGVEPHIWNSAVNARIIATNILNALCILDKSNEADYMERYNTLCNTLERTDSLICDMLSSPEADRAFMIYHPALSYFARDYDLHQIAMEDGGKEPSPAHLKQLIDACREEQVHVIFVQPEFDRRNAELIARQTGTRIIDINPLAYDWEKEMLAVARALTGKSGQTNENPPAGDTSAPQ